MTPPLNGIKILDFTRLLPGPYGTMILADMGADIIKVEEKRIPDLLRLLPPIVDGVSAAFAHINRGKKSLAIDFHDERGKEIIRRLVGEYDIVVEQFRPGVMASFGLGYEDLKKENSSLIYCSLTGYGQTGTYSNRAGHDINYMSLSGIESYSGRKETGPSLMGIEIADIASGSKNLAIALLTAYIKRLRTGEGDYIDLSITDGAFSMSVLTAAGFLVDGREPAAESEIFNGGTLYDFYRTSDGRFLSVGLLEPKFLKAFGEAMGQPDLMDRMIASPQRIPEIKKEIAGIIGGQTLDYWREKFNIYNACVEPVATLGEAVSSPPVSEREMIISVTTSKGNPVRQIGNPVKFRSGHFHAKSAGVPLGFHNDEIIRSIGYSDNEIEALKKDGVI